MNNTIAYKRAQLPANALTIGIDPHKKQHTIKPVNRQAHALPSFQLTNDRAGFEDLLKRSERLRKQQGADTCIFAIEPAGPYWRNLAYFLAEHNQTFYLVNPFTLKRQRDGNDLMHKKNDDRDAEMAASLVQEGKYTWTTLPQGVYAELRQAHHTYQQLVGEVARVKLQLTTTLDGLFPEFTAVFKQVNGQTALTILRICPNPSDVVAYTEDTFATMMQIAHGKQRLSVQKVRRLYRAAHSSVGIKAGARAQNAAIRLLAERLIFLQSQRQQAEDHLIALFRTCDESKYLLSLHGLGAVNAAGLLAHIGDIRHFSGVKDLPKLAGIIPTENSSAGRQSGRTPMSKKGRPDLRTVLYRAVIGLLRHQPLFKQYVKRLTERPAQDHPLKKREAIGAAMNKLLRIVYALLTKREMFDARKALAA